MAKGNISVNFEPVREALFDWLNISINRLDNGTVLPEGNANAIPVLRTEQNAVAPQGEYVEYKFLTDLIGQGQRRELLYDGVRQQYYLRGRFNFAVQVTAFGERSRELIAQIQMGLSAPNIKEVLRTACLSVRDENTINDATVFQEEDHEERSILDVRFGITLDNYNLVADLSCIENVQLKNQIVDPTASGPYTVTISKP